MRFLASGMTILLAAALIFILTDANASAGKPGSGSAPSVPTVCIDAGHGGSDPGAVYDGLQEKQFTLDIALRLKARLEASGFKVVMTRTDNQTTLDNSDRAALCNRGGANSVVSIHLNASSNYSADYFKAFYGKQNKDRAFTQTIWDNFNLTDAYDSALPQDKSPIAPFASGVLLKANAPATLAETVFLSNPQERELLRDPSGARQQEIAENLFLGIEAWYAK